MWPVPETKEQVSVHAEGALWISGVLRLAMDKAGAILDRSGDGIVPIEAAVELLDDFRLGCHGTMEEIRAGAEDERRSIQERLYLAGAFVIIEDFMLHLEGVARSWRKNPERVRWATVAEALTALGRGSAQATDEVMGDLVQIDWDRLVP